MKHHSWYYLFQFIIFTSGIFVIAFLHFSKPLQIAIFIMLAMFYVILGILHHAGNHTITAKIVIEYIAIATVAISLLVFVLQGI
jgi:hypothetical protein